MPHGASAKGGARFANAGARVILLRQPSIRSRSRQNAVNASQLPIPLDIYARTMQLEFGGVDSIGYGIWPSSAPQTLNLADAHSLFADKLIDCCNQWQQSGYQVLVSGESLRSLAEHLASTGAIVTWLSQSGESAKVSVIQSSITQHRAEGVFDFVVLEGTFKYLDQLSILTQIRSLLKEGGRCLIFGEFLHDDSKIEWSPLANLTSFRQLSERLGLPVSSEEDLSAAARPSLQEMLGLLRKHEAELVQKFEVQQSDIEELVTALTKADMEFGSGRRGFDLFTLERVVDTSDAYCNVVYGDIDSFEPAEVALVFESAFDTPFNPDLWHWKYRLGKGVCVVARRAPGDEILSHYGGAPREISYFGTDATAIQVCDVMALPEIRRHYGKRSLFFKAAATFLEREIGYTVKHLLGFGFPNQKAMNIATRLGLYEKTDDFVGLEFVEVAPEAIEKLTEYSLQSLALDEEDVYGHINELWHSQRADFADSIIGVRDSQYLHYRYHEHPYAKAGRYRVMGIWQGEVLRAVAVIMAHEEEALLMDIVCPLAQTRVMIDILQVLLRQGGETSRLKMWITLAWLDKIKKPEDQVKELCIEIPCNSWNPGPPSDKLYGAWWLTAGDMDFM